MLGDYGYVVVIEYNITTTKTVTTTEKEEEESESTTITSTGSDDDNNENDSTTTTTSENTTTTFWALYGHLDRKGIKRLQRRVGQRVARGDIIGYVGDIDDNGGWIAPHVHFQLSLIEPETHDMPGAASVADRNRALLQYPDPRYLLGPLY